MATRTVSLYSQAALDLKAGKITLAEYWPAVKKEAAATVRRLIKEATARIKKEAAEAKGAKGR